ncbi:MAG: hypothetical protein ACPG61_15605 [Paracoccaceae bacterium]
MAQDDEKLIARMPNGPLTERELQETRHSNHKIIDKLVSSDEIREWGNKVDRLWLCLGWLPMTVTNWKALCVALLLAALLGGQAFIDRLATLMGTYLP